MPRTFVLHLAFALSLAFTSWAAAQRLTVVTDAQPDTLDPHVTSATSAFQHTKSLYDTLVEVKRNGSIGPLLAEEWTVSGDGLTWRFNLADATFHDGTAFDASDVVASLERLQAEATGSPKASEYAVIDRVIASGERTVELQLSAPAPALLATLASGWSAMLPSEKIASGHDFATDPVGTGAFTLDSWTRDSAMRLNANDGYFKGAPAIEGVTVRYVADSALQLQALRTGEAHVATSIATADLPIVENDAELNLVREPSGLALVASLNTRRPYLDDPRVRRALNLAVDEQAVLDVAYGGGTPIGTFMEAGSPWLPAGVAPFGQDLEEARALLEAAGVPDDWTLDMALPQPYESHVTAGQAVQDMLQGVGVDANVRVVEWGVWLSEVYGGPRDFDVTVIGHTGKLDPTGRLDGYGVPSDNYVGFGDADVAGWLDDGRTTTDLAARQDAYTNVLTRMHEEPPFIYFGTPDRTYAARTDVSGFWMTPLLDSFDFREVTLD
jgi:peptide/nickel transport system substrate-binding protein